MVTPGTDPAFRKSSDYKSLPALRLGQVVRFSGYRDQQLKIVEQVVPLSAGHCMGAGFSLGGAYNVNIWVYIAFRSKHRSLPFCARIARSKTKCIAKRSTCTELVKEVQVPRIPTVPYRRRCRLTGCRGLVAVCSPSCPRLHTCGQVGGFSHILLGPVGQNYTSRLLQLYLLNETYTVFWGCAQCESRASCATTSCIMSFDLFGMGGGLLT